MAMTDALRAGARVLRPAATATLPTGEAIELDGGDIVSIEIQEGADSALTPGCVLSASYALVLDNAGGRWLPEAGSGQECPLRGATVRLYLEALDGGTWRRAPLGVFIASGASACEQQPVIRLKGSDSIASALSAPFEDGLSYPCELQQLWRHAAAQSGYEWQGTVPNGDAIIDAKPDWGAISLRRAMGFIAAAAGSFVQVDREGALRLMPCRRVTAQAALSPDDYMRLTDGFERFGPVNGLQIMPAPDAERNREALTVYSDGNAGEVLSVENNPLFMHGAAHLQALAEGMLAQLSGLRLTKAEFRWRGDPAVGVGSRILLTDTHGREHPATVTRQTLRFNRGFSATCACETPGASGGGVRRLVTPGGGLDAGALVGTVDGGLLRAGSVTARTIAAQSITAEHLAAGAVTAQSIEAVRAHIRELVADDLTADELFAALATIATAQITTAHIRDANIDWAAIANLTVQIAQIATAQITTAHIQSANISWASIQNLTAQIAQIATAQIGTASIQQANIDWAQITSLNAQIAAIANARIGQASITTAQISDLTAQIASVVTLAAQNGDFNFARVQSLVAGAMILTEGVGGSVYIDNLAATSAMLAQATLGELVLKGSNGNYYEVTCEADGTLRTRQVTVSAAEIAAGQTSAGKAIVATNANITSLNAQTIKAKSAVISQIMAAAIEAEQITAGQAFIAMAEIPQLAATAISALGEALTIRGEHVRIESAGASQSLETVLTRLRGDAETAMQTLSGLGVGGVNLVDDSDVITITGTDDTSTSFRCLANDLEPGRTYTLSMASATLLQGSAAGMTLGVYKRKDGTASPILWKVLDFTGGRQKYTFTTPADGDSYYVNLFAGIRGASNGVVVEVTKVKLEEGTFATTWTPSTADAEVPLADLRTTLETYPGGFGALVEHVQGDLDGAASDLYSFFRFYDDNGEPHLEMGSSNSAMKMDLSNSRLSFRMGTLEVAYFSDNKLYVTNVEAIERLSVGTPQNGYLEMVTTETGVGFLWRS